MQYPIIRNGRIKDIGKINLKAHSYFHSISFSGDADTQFSEVNYLVLISSNKTNKINCLILPKNALKCRWKKKYFQNSRTILKSRRNKIEQ